MYDTFRISGAEAAMMKFAVAEGIDAGPTPPPEPLLDPRVKEMMVMRQKNEEFWFEHELRQYPRAVLDLTALRAARGQAGIGGRA